MGAVTATKSLDHKVANGTVWVSMAIMTARILFFVTSIVTARVLTPYDYGLMGMAATVTTLFQTTSANGIDNFIICQQDDADRVINTAFTLNGLMGIVMSVALIASGPLLAIFYKQPELPTLLMFAGMCFLVNILGRVPRSILVKEMRQDITSVTDTTTSFINFILIILLALSGFKYLSYVIPLLITQTINTVTYFILARHHFKLEIRMEIAKKIFRYSKNYLPQMLLTYLFSQSDYILAGVFLGSQLLGYYYFGFEKAFLVLFMIQSLSNQVFFPLFSKYQADPEKLKESYLNITSYTMLFVFPLIFIMLFCSEQLLPLFYGARWMGAMFTFRFMLGFCFLKVSLDISVAMLNAIGQPKENLKHFAIITPLAVTLLWFGVTRGGINGLTLAAFSSHTLSALLMLLRLKYYFGWSLGMLLRHIGRHLALLAIPLPALAFLKWELLRMGSSHLTVLLAVSSVFGVCYIALAKLLYPKLFQGCVGFIRQKISARLKLIPLRA